ncbi:hypothetical protein, partial [Flavobacterium psychrophilum]|uniref:hypothetical protein n=1 Tax=Flavobacterium psychrophilum TaxID=96345 RepID=UPI001D09712D
LLRSQTGFSSNMSTIFYLPFFIVCCLRRVLVAYRLTFCGFAMVGKSKPKIFDLRLTFPSTKPTLN